MYNNGYSAATDFFCNIMTPDDILPVNILLNKISKAPSAAKRYLEKHCRDAQELEEFFRENEHLFYVENKRLALFDDRHIEDFEMSVDYFQQKLKDFGRPMDYMLLKIKHLEHAPQRICLFITRFYPGKEIKKFFKKKPDIFVVHKNHTVFLVEEDSVSFYKKQLKLLKGEKQHFIKFRGHIGQADRHVQEYINRYFCGDDFQDFLIRNNHVFRLDEDGYVSLISTA